MFPNVFQHRFGVAISVHLKSLALDNPNMDTGGQIRCKKQQLAAHTMLKRNNAIEVWQFHYQWWTLKGTMLREEIWLCLNIGYPKIH